MNKITCVVLLLISSNVFAHGLEVYQSFQGWNTNCFREMTAMSQTKIDFQIFEPSHITLIGHFNMHHRGLVNGAVGYVLQLTYKYATTQEGLGNTTKKSIKGRSGGNIHNETHHYAEGNIDGYLKADDIGWYRIQAWCNSHSSLAPNTDGLIEVLGDGGSAAPYNQLTVQVHPSN